MDEDSGDARLGVANPDALAQLLSAQDALRAVGAVIAQYAHPEPISAEGAMDILLGIAAKHPAFVRAREGQ